MCQSTKLILLLLHRNIDLHYISRSRYSQANMLQLASSCIILLLNWRPIPFLCLKSPYNYRL